MAHSSIADLMSLFSDLVDFWHSAHEAVLERRRKRVQARSDKAQAHMAKAAQLQDAEAQRAAMPTTGATDTPIAR